MVWVILVFPGLDRFEGNDPSIDRDIVSVHAKRQVKWPCPHPGTRYGITTVISFRSPRLMNSIDVPVPRHNFPFQRKQFARRGTGKGDRSSCFQFGLETVQRSRLQLIYSGFLGLPRGRSVDLRPSCLAVSSIH